MQEVKARLTEKVKANAEINPDAPAAELPEPYLNRALELRDRIDKHQFPPSTERLDEKRAKYWIRGGRFYDAPNGIIVYIEKALYPLMLLDVGIMVQTICLAALAHGLGSCPVRRAVYWPDMLRELLGIPESKAIVIGIAIGYANPDARVNNYVRQREPLESWVRWHGI
jgi:nitroreductase